MRVLEALSLYPDRKDLFSEFPELEEEDIRQALSFAAENMGDRLIIRGQADAILRNFEIIREAF
jgi:uncharacterized protein (DUF433 family)